MDPLREAKEIIEHRFSDHEQWIVHKGTRILLNNYADKNISDLPAAVNANKNAIKNRGRKNLLVLLDLSNVFANREILALFKKTSVELKPYIRKSAVIGIAGVQRYFLNIVNTVSSMNTRAFESKKEALDWLIEP